MPMTLAHIITGSFGSGKTSAIRRLMANKPQDELWIVGLNEFTEAKQLRDILRNFKPVRLLVEPSGAGHAVKAVFRTILAGAKPRTRVARGQRISPRQPH
jgi:G3E family GTPase